jgi:hypothetical protein
MAGLFPAGLLTEKRHALDCRQRTNPAALRWMCGRQSPMGKLFLIIVAISVAILVAMGAYVISL